MDTTGINESEGADDKSGSGAESAASLVKSALQAAQQGEGELALQQLSKAEQLDPKERDLWSLRAGHALASGDSMNGIAYLRKEIATILTTVAR